MRTELVETKLVVLETLELEADDLKGLLRMRGLYDLAAESVWVVGYDAARSVRTMNEIAKGDSHHVEMSMPVLFNAVLLAGADRFLLVHNHPSGMVLPSQLDIDVSQRVMDAANLMGLYYEDFVIIGPGEAMFSFAESGLLIPATPSQPRAAFGEPIVLR